MEKTGSSMKYAGMFFDQFEKEFGSTRCKGVQEHQFGRSYDFLNPEEQKLFQKLVQEVCERKTDPYTAAERLILQLIQPQDT